MTTRRRMLQSTGIAAAAMPLILQSNTLTQRAMAAPSDRIRLGVIGIGPRCRYVLGGMLKHKDVQCVAISDVQASRATTGKKLVDDQAGDNTCELIPDFRRLLDRDDIDAVLIATGDRWHATASMLAAESGKDVYSEKPCGITIDLCRRLSETIQRTGRVFQAGTQRRSVANFQQAVKLAHEGKLGTLRQLHATVYTPEIKTTWLPGQPTPDAKQCNWNLWLGPAPWRPFNQDYVDGRWRGYYDFDSGARLLDWGAHTVDLCQWANQSDDTLPIEYRPVEGGIEAKYSNGVLLKLHFLETPFGQRPGWVQSLGTCPVRFEGDAGSVEVGDSGGIVVKPESLADQLPKLPEKQSGLDVEAHSRNFLDCIKTRELPAANHVVMRRSHTACHAAALSWLLGRTLRMDPKSETFVNDDEANRLRKRPERDWA
ncbi:Gfo/Idh/MocA family oxidoreductase [Roseiconus nitratireducens]|uniref:Gfo/Idh/MocA family oxidoreductase n=1 Tax=Roseiconus nitratireducens TaxID=2605748 RepID=A0A5M6D1R3_9BACT|nr:Gfo/Idh/MocA family oxidoreductase [Roseiconus nitratireducens]KAA5541424.1 Gfo/Idh/MocA family oxidoreductase [Roseiconus nitratireducens]